MGEREPEFVPAEDGSDRVTVNRLALIARWSETFGLDLTSGVEAALAQQEADHVAHLCAEAAHHALCWVQPDDGRIVACDRAAGHKGDHSWELASQWGPAPERVEVSYTQVSDEMRVAVLESAAEAYRQSHGGGLVVTLVEFLAVRYDEIEAAAKATGGKAWLGHTQQPTEVVTFTGGLAWHLNAPTPEAAQHILRNDPAHVLADIMAKRKILAVYEHDGSAPARERRGRSAGVVDG